MDLSLDLDFYCTTCHKIVLLDNPRRTFACHHMRAICGNCVGLNKCPTCNTALVQADSNAAQQDVKNCG